MTDACAYENASTRTYSPHRRLGLSVVLLGPVPVDTHSGREIVRFVFVWSGSSPGPTLPTLTPAAWEIRSAVGPKTVLAM